MDYYTCQQRSARAEYRNARNFFVFFVGTTGMPFRGKTVLANGLVRKPLGEPQLARNFLFLFFCFFGIP